SEIRAEARARGCEAAVRRLDRLDREKAETLVDAYWLLCRALLLAQSGAPASLLIDADHAAELAREAEGWTIDQLLATIDLCRQAYDALLRNVAPRLTLEVLLSRLALRPAWAGTHERLSRRRPASRGGPGRRLPRCGRPRAPRRRPRARRDVRREHHRRGAPAPARDSRGEEGPALPARPAPCNRGGGASVPRAPGPRGAGHRDSPAGGPGPRPRAEGHRRRDAPGGASSHRVLQRRGAHRFPRPGARPRPRAPRAHRDAPDRRPRHHAAARRHRSVRPPALLLLAPTA